MNILRAPKPVWVGEDEGAKGGTGEGTDQGNKDTSQGDKGGEGDKGSTQTASDAFAAFDEDTRGWLQTKGFKGVDDVVKSARESEKMLGDRIKVPGKDATPEERDAFLEKLGRPKTPDGYEFKAPANLPEGLPYDGERANKLKTVLHQAGVPAEQAQLIHDAYIADAVEAFNAQSGATKQVQEEQAKTAVATLEKEWGPLRGEKAQAQLELADRVFTEVPGGQEFLAELKAKGLVGEDKTVFSAPMAKFLANIGAAFFKEGDVLRGQVAEVGNVFADGEHFNLTEAGKIVKSDPDRARQLIAAAGKKPDEFGLKSGA
jgi:hypothetical protein